VGINSTSRIDQKHARTRQLGRLRLMTLLPMPLPSNRE
jgi:hypothetical protein